MHPTNFFNEVDCVSYEAIQPAIKEELQGIHPLNFICSRISIPVYGVEISYLTSKGNHKTAKKHLMINSDMSDGLDSIDYYIEVMVQRHVETYKQHPYKPMLDVSIGAITRKCDAVLNVG